MKRVAWSAMKMQRNFFAAILFFAAGIFTAAAQSSNAVASAPVYVPDYSHAGEPLPDGVIAWDATMKIVDAAADQDFAKFTFSFTNIATVADITLITNVTATATEITAVTNFTPCNVTILNVHPSCGCTTAELPPTPWTIPPGTSGEIKLSINLAGKSGTIIKTVAVTTDKGKKDLMLRVNILPPVVVKMTEEQKAAGIAAAKVDRQAVFKGDCASCHLKNVGGTYGQQLFNSACAICHEAENRATMVPDLGKLRVPTNQEFWRTWITFGKPGSLMPAFAASQGGPLSDLQIASLAQYLNTVHPSQVPPVGQ